MKNGVDEEVPKQIELEENEKVVALIRQHWFVFRNPVLIGLFIPFVLLFGVFISSYYIENLKVLDLLHNVLLFLAGAALIIGFFLFVWRLFLWRRTFYLVTSKRIILISQYGLFHHDDRETSLSMIQDVKALVDGMEPSLYGFGEVIVQVSSQDAQLQLHKVPKPREVQRIIMKEAHLRD